MKWKPASVPLSTTGETNVAWERLTGRLEPQLWEKIFDPPLVTHPGDLGMQPAGLVVSEVPLAELETADIPDLAASDEEVAAGLLLAARELFRSELIRSLQEVLETCKPLPQRQAASSETAVKCPNCNALHSGELDDDDLEDDDLDEDGPGHSR